jgi:hypothetical protein
MAWEKTHSVTIKGINQENIWRVWADINQWHHWDTDIEFAKIETSFAEGNYFILKPKGGPRVKIKLLKVNPMSSFTDLTAFPLAKMYGIHTLRETQAGLEVTHTVRIEGPLGFLWKKLVAEKVAAGLEEQAEKMIQRARDLEINA